MSNNYITKSALLFDICHVLIKPQNPTRGPAVSTAQLVAREEPKVSIKGTLPDVKVLTKTRILPVPLSSSTLRIYGMEQPTPVKKPIKESINISSLLTQKHSYRSFQSRAIRGQTSIRYGRKQSPPPRHSLCSSQVMSSESLSQDDSGFRYFYIKQIINH